MIPIIANNIITIRAIEMNEQISKCLNDMMDFLGYEPDKKQFRLFSNDLISHYRLENLVKYVRDIDQSGSTAIVYLSSQCQKVLKETMVNVYDFIQDNSIINKFVTINKLLNSDIVVNTKSTMIDFLVSFASKSVGSKFIGDVNSDEVQKDFVCSIEAVVEELQNLKFEVYMKSNAPIGKIEKFSPEIQVFGSLAECILTLEKSNDGICVCYISNSGLNGYFGFFVKSNGNLFSMNERIDEVYIGQHNRQRNGRYAENKAFRLFPYDEVCKFSGEDYKGYYTDIEIDRKVLNIFELGKTNRSVYMRMIISMALLVNKYAGIIIDNEEVIINSLLSNNLKQLETNALAKYGESCIIKRESDFKIEFDRDKFLRGEYNAEFDNSNESRKYNEKGYFEGYNQILVNTYGDDFDFNNKELLKSNSSKKLIGDVETDLEFVGSKKKMELQAYFNLRNRLANHISKRMKEDYNNFGGKDKLIEWYRNCLLKIMDKIKSLCIEAYDAYTLKQNENIEFNEYGFGKKDDIIRNDFTGRTTTIDGRSHISILNKQKDAIQSAFIYYGGRAGMILTPYELDRYGWPNKLLCPFTRTKANIFFAFHFRKWYQIEDFIETELPKFCKGWRNANLVDDKYTGNSILDATDAVSRLESPVYCGDGNKQGFDFAFVLGFSKKGFNLLRKENEQPK